MTIYATMNLFKRQILIICIEIFLRERINPNIPFKAVPKAPNRAMANVMFSRVNKDCRLLVKSFIKI